MTRLYEANPLACFLKLNRIINHATQVSVSRYTGIDISLISRIENGRRIPNEEQRKILLEYYQTDEQTYSETNQIVNHRLSDLFSAIYEAQPFDLQGSILAAISLDSIKKTHYFPYLYLLTFCHYVNAGQVEKATPLFENLIKIVTTLEPDLQALFYMYASLYHFHLNRIDLREKDIFKMEHLCIQDERILALSHFFELFISPNHHDIQCILEHFSLCQILLKTAAALSH